MQPYLPAHAPFSDSFDAFKQRGMLRELMDLVRHRPLRLRASVERCGLAA
jgi:hypothetical protein